MPSQPIDLIEMLAWAVSVDLRISLLPGLIFWMAYRLLYSSAEAIRKTAMLRITVVNSSKIAVTLRAEGRITGPWVEELRTACNVHAFPGEVQLSLELAEISFADAAGIALLRELQNRGVGFVGVTPFLTEQLKNATSSLEF